jgi:hypothetical protein
MDKKHIEEQIRSAYQSDIPNVLDRIKSSPDYYVPEKAKQAPWERIFNRRVSLLAATIIVIALVIIGFQSNTSTPVIASTVTIDVNPSIQINLGEDDLVLEVIALNDDGDEILSRDIEYLGMTLDEVITILMNRLDELGYISSIDTEENIVLLDVGATNDEIRERIELQVKQYLDRELQKFPAAHWVLSAKDIQLTEEQRQAVINAAAENPETRAKLILIYRIHGLNENLSIRALARLNIRQLYRLYIELEDPDNLPYYDQMPGHQNHEREPYGTGQSA